MIDKKAPDRRRTAGMRGYLLPAVIFLSLAIGAVSLFFLQVLANSNQTLTRQAYDQIAQEAAQSGIAYLNSCLSVAPVADWTAVHRPNSPCSESGSTAGSEYITEADDGSWRSTFTISVPAVQPQYSDARYRSVSTGIVEILSNGEVVDRVTATRVIVFESTADISNPSTGEAVTEIKAGRNACAIANGKLYCWGNNAFGQLGIGSTSSSAVPRLINGASDANPTQHPLYGKTVTSVNVSDKVVCVSADGEPYCWGNNAFYELGSGPAKTSRSKPTADTPRTSSGPLANAFVTEITTAPYNMPFPGWLTDPHSCAVTADGSAVCWGDNGHRQQGHGGCGINLVDIRIDLPFNLHIWIPILNPFDPRFPGYWTNTFSIVKVPYYTCNYNEDNQPYPQYVSSQTTSGSHLYGKRVIRGGASTHDSCFLSETGHPVCMGVRAPVPVMCTTPISWGQGFDARIDDIRDILNLSQLTALAPTAWICQNDYAKSYIPVTREPFTGISIGGNDFGIPVGGSAFDNRYIDPETWELDTDYLCAMADDAFPCFGKTPAYSPLWFLSWIPPIDWRSNVNLMYNTAKNGSLSTAGPTDVTDSDNSENVDAVNLGGLHCVINKGVAGCAKGFATLPSNLTGLIPLTYSPLTLSNLGKDVPTIIAAGAETIALDYGCLGANGRMYCWGATANGGLANGNLAAAHGNPIRAGTNGATPIGSNDGTIAATETSIGSTHGCDIANTKVFCWGKNNYGQLGNGEGEDTTQPHAVADLVSKASTKVSSGANHSCAIVESKLWCWGLDSNGQLGRDGNTAGCSSTTPRYCSTPRQVTANGFDGKRVTQVSASNNGTCAIANGQVYCWGSNNGQGKIGDNTINNSYGSPQLISGRGALPSAKVATDISTGKEHTCAIAGGDAYCWGNNSNGQLGTGSVNPSSTPQLVTGGAASSPTRSAATGSTRPLASKVTVGDNFSCGIFNGKVACWGSNAGGRTGINVTTNTNTLSPANLYGPAGTYYATEITAGNSHACALIHGDRSALNGNIWCWGSNTFGQIGVNANTPGQPMRVTAGDTADIHGNNRRVATKISASGDTTCAVANAARLCWGRGTEGQLGNSYTFTSTLPAISAPYIIQTPFKKGAVF